MRIFEVNKAGMRQIVLNNPQKFANSFMLFENRDSFMLTAQKLNMNQNLGFQRVFAKLKAEMSCILLDKATLEDIAKDIEFVSRKVIKSISKN